DDVAEAALVLEGEVPRVVRVDVRLRGAVDQQRPGPGPLPVGQELGEPAVDALGDGLGRRLPPPGVPGLSHSRIVPSRPAARPAGPPRGTGRAGRDGGPSPPGPYTEPTRPAYGSHPDRARAGRVTGCRRGSTGRVRRLCRAGALAAGARWGPVPAAPCRPLPTARRWPGPAARWPPGPRARRRPGP